MLTSYPLCCPLQDHSCHLLYLLDPAFSNTWYIILSVVALYTSYDRFLKSTIDVLITSKLDYYNRSDVGLQKFQLVQKAAGGLSSRGRDWNYATPVLKYLPQRPVSFWAQFKVLALDSKYLGGLASLKNRHLPYSPTHQF